MTAWHCEQAWLDGRVARDVLVSVSPAGIIEDVSEDLAAPAGAARLRGVVLPGFANAHSHAFHRALRGRTHADGGSFWSWREAMYAVAAALDPQSMYALARATYAEMVLAGFTAVGEFHYLHHGPGGRRYDNPNEMAEALRAAAADAGIRLTLLDTCYLTGGIGRPLEGPQLRFGDGSAEAWSRRTHELRPDATTRLGAAVHSVRAVPEVDLSTVASARPESPLHAHLSEQPKENESSVAAYGRTPTQVFADHGLLSPRFTAVHATHLTSDDITLLGTSGASICLCPTTERDLADGIGPASALVAQGARLCLGTDQHAVVDGFEEARGVEMHERLASGERGRFTPSELIDILTWRGHASIGWPEAGRIAVGSPADLVAVSTTSARTAGCLADQIALAATAADVTDVVVGGRAVVGDHEHESMGAVGPLLEAAIDAIWATVDR